MHFTYENNGKVVQWNEKNTQVTINLTFLLRFILKTL